MKMANHQTREFKIWQWNCAGYNNKRPVLQQYFRSTQNKPDVIALQEAGSGYVTLTGYKAVECQTRGRGLYVLINKQHTHIEHDLKIRDKSLEYLMIELVLPTSYKGQRPNSLFILNLYSSPRKRHQQFKNILDKAQQLAENKQLIVCGDFNAAHTAWGYVRCDRKGRDLLEHVEELDLTIITDKRYPTRLGNSVCRDTTPDLTLTKNIQAAKWLNTGQNFGSDHYIIEVTLEVNKSKYREYEVVDWDVFRKLRLERADQMQTKPDLKDWCDEIQRDIIKATRKINTDAHIEAMDSKLAHLIEAKQAILLRWRSQRLNSRLRKRIAELNKQIEQHCATLCRQQWNEFCKSIDGQLRNGKAWKAAVKHLLDKGHTKVAQRHHMARAIHMALKDQEPQTILQQLTSIFPSAQHRTQLLQMG